MLVTPSEVFYQPKFTYIWTLAVGRFPDGAPPPRTAGDGGSRDRAMFSRRSRDHDSR